MIVKSAEFEALRAEAAGCRRCALWANATQTVFGEGGAGAEIVLVGEQPGDREDIAGNYVTNAVKHFKNEIQGKRRLHKKPNVSEIEHCRWWLEKETTLLAPKLTVALGATALRSLIGRNEPIMQSRAKLLRSPFAGRVFVTIHPSLLLRLRDADERRREFDSFVSDLALARQFAEE